MHSIKNLRTGRRPSKGLLYLLCLLLTSNAFAIEYFVSKNGSNTNGLSTQTAFATVQQAADVAGPGDIVNVMAGTYREQVVIRSNGVIFRPYGGDQVTFNGADLMLNWIPVANSTYRTTMNWDVDPAWGTNQVFQDGSMLELARWPKQTATDLVMPSNARADDVTASGSSILITDSDFFNVAGNSTRWVGAKIWINLSRAGYDGQGWTGTVRAISGNAIQVDFGNPRIGNMPWGLGPDAEYFLFDPLPGAVNAAGGVEALLGAGEWWKDGSTLYAKTRTGAAPASSATAASNLIEAKSRHFAFWPKDGNHSGYTIKGFHLFACAITTDKNAATNQKVVANRIIVEDARDIVLEGLVVKYPSHQTDMSGNWQDQHYAWSGIVLSGRNNTLRDCEISLSATSAVSISGAGNKVLRNRIHTTNYMCSNAGAVNTGFISQDHDIGHNTIWNTTMAAVNFRYSTNSNPNNRNVSRIHHNQIYDFMRRSGDSGALDVFGQDLQWIRIDHNRIYNTLDDAKIGFLKHGIYLDYGDGSKGHAIRANIDHNVIYGVNNPVLVNPGADVNVFNNVLLSHLIETDQFSHLFLKALIVNLRTDFPNTGQRIRVYNNILNTEIPNVTSSPYDIRNNLFDAKGAVLTELFVDAGAHDYRLKSTATRAIDQGISVAEFMVNNYDEPVTGITDIGAFEFTTPTPALRTADNPAGTAPGLAFNYYDATGWTHLDAIDAPTTPVARQGNVLNFDVSPKTSEVNYAFKYSGYVFVPADGVYTFYLNSDDGSRLYIGSTEVINNDGLHGAREYPGTIGLRAGKHQLTVNYFQAGGGATLGVSYSGPNLSKRAIPNEALSRWSSAGLGGTYRITARHSGKSLDVASASTADGANVMQWTADLTNNPTNQQWIVTATADGYYTVVNKKSNKALEAEGGRLNDGANVQQWTIYGTPSNHQQWTLEATTDGFYRLLNRNSGKALDVQGGEAATQDGANVHQWGYFGYNNQQWKLEQLAAPNATRTVSAGNDPPPHETEAAAKNLTVFPNPVTGGWFNLELDAATADQPVKVILTDLAGRKVRETTFTGNGRARRIETGNLPPGLYLVTAASGDSRWVRKVKMGY
jgi:hypothetical protein